MIKMTYMNASNQQFVNAFTRIANTPMNTKLAYNFKKIADAVLAVKKQIARDFEETLIKKYCELDSEGHPIVDDNQEGFKIKEGQQEAFQAAEVEFGKTEVTIDREPISLQSLCLYGVQLSPSELKVMEPVLLDDLEGIVPAPGPKLVTA